MSPEEATTLAAVIDKTHLPFRVKRIATQPGNKAVVEVEDEQTGYTLPIVSPEHWRRFASQSGNAGALDTFGETGTRVLGYLDQVIKKLETQRDDLLQQAEQFDERVRLVIAQKGDIEKAVAAVDSIGTFTSIAPQLRQPSTGREVTISEAGPTTVPDFLGDPPAIRVPATEPSPKRKKRPLAPIGKLPGNERRKTPSGETQKDWTLRQLEARGRIRVMDLAAELSPLLSVPKENLIKTISSLLSYEMKRNPQITRPSLGWYEYRRKTGPGGAAFLETNRYSAMALIGTASPTDELTGRLPRGPYAVREPLTPPQPAATTPQPDSPPPDDGGNIYSGADATPEPPVPTDTAEEHPDAGQV